MSGTDLLKGSNFDSAYSQEDKFVINDVALRIDPESIFIEKKAFNHEWQTLRTRSSQKAKSGYGTARVVVDTTFLMSKEQDRQNLINLVAGLRATPFCVVYSPYLEKNLGRPDSIQPGVKQSGDYDYFRPIMLAVASMTFSTMGHEGKPDCVRALFDFIWFNYSPYTDYIAFKTGTNFSQPGFAKDCLIWKKFYEPFTGTLRGIQWPHEPDDIFNRTTQFMWREYLMLPKGSPDAIEVSKKIAEAIKNYPEKAFKSVKDWFRTAEGLTELDPKIMNDGALQTVFRKLVREGYANPSEELKQRLQSLPSSSIEESGGNVIYPLLRRLYNKDKLSKADLDEISYSISILEARQKQLQKVSARGDVLLNQLNNTNKGKSDPEKYVELENIDAKVGSKDGGEFSIGGLQLFGRKQFYNITHRVRDILGDKEEIPNAIIQQIVVTFENVLATIPMVGYRYPTIQHVGSMDAKVRMVVNTLPEAAADLNNMYNSVESMALRYKQIPAGFNNLTITNDFLGLFNLTEFLTENMTTETIQSQPDRSLVEIAFVEAGITSKTHVDFPEEIQQEFIMDNTGIKKELWKIFWRNSHIVDIVRKPAEKSIIKTTGPGFSIGYNRSVRPFAKKQEVPDDTQLKAYFRQVATFEDTRNIAFRSLVQEAVTAYNEFVTEVHGAIFQHSKGKGPYPGTLQHYYQAFLSIPEEGPDYEFIPGYNEVKNSIVQRDKVYREKKEKMGVTRINVGDTKTNKQLREEAKARRKLRYIKESDVERNPVELINQRKELVHPIINKYLSKMDQIFFRAKENIEYVDLPQLKDVQEKIDKIGLGKGIMAYPDFQGQLASVAGMINDFEDIENASSINRELLRYDPDCYFWYPHYSGGTNSNLYSLVDESYMTMARQHSLQIWRNAQGDVGRFFTEVYVDKLGQGTNRRPYDVLVKNTDNKQLRPNLYRNITQTGIKNTLQQEMIKKSVVADSAAKVHSNWYDEEGQHLKSSSLCSHIFDLEEQWRGIDVGQNDSPKYSNPTPISSNVFDPDAANVAEVSVDPSKGSKPKPSAKLKGKNQWDKLDELRTEVQPLFEAVLDELKAKGFNPRISNAYRSSAQQMEKVAQGRSKLTGPGAHTWGLAADIIDRRWGWKETDQNAHFFGQLYQAAKKQGLTWGGSWYGKGGTRNNPTFTNGWYKWKIGWDPAHIQYPSSKTPNEWKRDAKTGQSTGLQRWTPKKKPVSKAAGDSSRLEVTTNAASPLKEAIKEFEKDLLNGQGQTMMRAYPTFKLYFIEDDSLESKRLAFDDFFSYSAVQSIRIVRSRKIAADLCEIYLTNVSGNLSNRKFRQQPKSDKPRTSKGEISQETTDASRANTAKENPIASLLLKEGVKIHLRLGYNSDPDLLEKVFNGVITNVQFSESDDIVKVIAQSYAIELIQDIKGFQKPIEKSNFWGWTALGFDSEASTGRILEEMMAEPEVLHFGRWSPKNNRTTHGRELLTQRWTFNPQPQDDNIFAPSPDQDVKDFGDGLLFKNLKYVIYQTTVWDILQEMTLRHPNFIASVVPYSDQGTERATVFFGMPNQLYFHRFPTLDERIADGKIKKEEEEIHRKYSESKGSLKERKDMVLKMLKEAKPGKSEQYYNYRWKALSGEWSYLTSNASSWKPSLEELTQRYFKNQRLSTAQKSGWIRPFRNYHLITSSQHIISNNIQSNSRNVANNIVIRYPDEIDIGDDDVGPEQIAKAFSENEFTLKLDCSLPTEDIRTQIAQFVNVTNEDIAKRYALGLLCRNMKEIYKGEIVILGNPKIKPYDVVYLFDTYTDMIGAFEVEEVQHIFDQQHGFRTEIKPDMLVQASEWSLIGSNEAMGIFMEGAIQKIVGGKGIGGLVSSYYGSVMGLGINTFGGFLANKIINYTQLAQPVIMSPMLHHGRIFAGGVPTSKISTSVWETVFAEWNPAIDVGYSAWAEDVLDDVKGWIDKKIPFKNSVGNFWNNGGDNTR